MKKRIAQIWLIVVCYIFFYDVFVVVFGDNHIVADVFRSFQNKGKADVAVVICNINDVYFIAFTDNTIYFITLSLLL